jgi:Big-like domain-containing protein/hemolysin type calcium-binding protein/putative glycosyl hydrolase
MDAAGMGAGMVSGTPRRAPAARPVGSRVRARKAIVLVILAVASAALIAPTSAGAVRSEFFGIAQGPPISNADLGGIQRAHVRTMRYLFSWASVQPKQCCFNWGSQDKLMGRLVAHGIRVVPALWGSPSWAETYPARPPIDKLTAWQTFLKAFVGRYGPGGTYWPHFRIKYPGKTPLPVHAYQIWNEPNLRKYWIPYPDPTQYGKLLKASSVAIKGKYPKAQIVLGGTPGYGDTNAWDFLSRLYDQVAGVKSYFDVAALHPYGSTRDKVKTEIEKFRDAMTSHGDGATPLWITEIASGSARAADGGLNKGLQGQATMLKGTYKMVLANRNAWNVQRLFWYHWRDPLKSHATGCTFCATAGLLNHDYSAKPALSVFKSFTAETTPPVATIISGPSDGATIANPTPTFKFTSTEPGSTFECRLDSGSYAACGPPLTTPHLADGSHAFSVRATNPAGNLGPEASRTFTVDTTPPTTTIITGPSGLTNDPTPTFSFSSEPGASLQCRLDSTEESAWQGCSSPRTVAHLADGTHTFEVRAKDAAQNVGPPSSRTFTVDTAEVGVSGSTLSVTAATGAHDNLQITKPSSTTLRITDLASAPYTGSGVHTGAGCTRSGDYTANCTASGITLIRVLAADQADQVTNSTAFESALNGGPGDDTLIGGFAKDTLTGAAGADVIRGMNGNDLLNARDLTSDQMINCDGGGTPGRADKADLDLLPKDPSSVVSGCETKTRH